jgi:flagellar basal body-associated protein FliL
MNLIKSLKDLRFKGVENMSSKWIILSIILVILVILAIGGLSFNLLKNDLSQVFSPINGVDGINTTITVNGENVTNIINETTGTNLNITLHKNLSITYNGKTVVNGTTKVYDNYTISIDGKKTGSIS